MNRKKGLTVCRKLRIKNKLDIHTGICILFLLFDTFLSKGENSLIFPKKCYFLQFSKLKLIKIFAFRASINNFLRGKNIFKSGGRKKIFLVEIFTPVFIISSATSSYSLNLTSGRNNSQYLKSFTIRRVFRIFHQ